MKSFSPQLYRELHQKIENKVYLPGEKLPSERDLARHYEVSRQIIRTVLRKLELEELIVRRQGHGTFVAQRDFYSVSQRNPYCADPGNYYRLIHEHTDGHTSTKIINTGVVRGLNYFADRLELDKNDTIYVIHKLRYTGGHPVSIEYSYYPLKLFPDMDAYDFDQINVLDYMESRGHYIERFEESVMYVKADSRLIQYLDFPEDGYATYQEIVSYDQTGTILAYTECYFRSDCLELEFTIQYD